MVLLAPNERATNQEMKMKKLLIILLEEYKYRLSHLYVPFYAIMLLWAALRFLNLHSFNSYVSPVLFVFFGAQYFLKSERNRFYAELAIGCKEYFKLKLLDNILNSIFVLVMVLAVYWVPYLTGYMPNPDVFEILGWPLITMIITLQMLIGIDFIEAVAARFKARHKAEEASIGVGIVKAVSGVIVFMPMPLILVWINFAWGWNINILIAGLIVLIAIPWIGFWYYNKLMPNLPPVSAFKSN